MNIKFANVNGICSGIKFILLKLADNDAVDACILQDTSVIMHEHHL